MDEENGFSFFLGRKKNAQTPHVPVAALATFRDKEETPSPP